MTVTLEMVKEHLNLEGETVEETYLQVLLSAAQRAVGLTIRQPIAELDADDGALADQAVLLTIGTWYENREGATTEARSLPAEVPMSLTWITDLLRRWDDGSEDIAS
ncbi:head-tail connector protein [Sphingomonas sp. IW22]|uniref:head-tail connector protein n=1 Tax=Sphingomonas sp. IW22 TaxID=3242489 RepID=UPI003522B19A